MTPLNSIEFTFVLLQTVLDGPFPMKAAMKSRQSISRKVWPCETSTTLLCFMLSLSDHLLFISNCFIYEQRTVDWSKTYSTCARHTPCDKCRVTLPNIYNNVCVHICTHIHIPILCSETWKSITFAVTEVCGSPSYIDSENLQPVSR